MPPSCPTARRRGSVVPGVRGRLPGRPRAPAPRVAVTDLTSNNDGILTVVVIGIRYVDHGGARHDRPPGPPGPPAPHRPDARRRPGPPPAAAGADRSQRPGSTAPRRAGLRPVRPLGSG